MLTIAERAGFPATIIVRNGIEGTIAFPLMRPAKILCSVRRGDPVGRPHFLRHEIIFDVEKFLGQRVALEERLENPTAAQNAELIQKYLQEGKSSNELFDLRVKATCAGIKQALDWIALNPVDSLKNVTQGNF